MSGIRNGSISDVLLDTEAEIGVLNVCLDNDESEAIHLHAVIKSTNMGLYLMLVDDNALTDALEASVENEPVAMEDYVVSETFAPWADVVRATLQDLFTEYSVKMAMTTLANLQA